MKNIELLKLKFYHGQPNTEEDYRSLNTRYEILPYDFSRLYRLHARTKGVNVDIAPERNIHNWLDRESKDYKPELANAVFHYQPRTSTNDRFVLCIVTEEMKEATWKYCHRSQLILDGTFRVCSSKLLLFIAMAVDHESKGVPLAMFLFSAPTGNQATQAGYNTDILSKLLKIWHYKLGVRDGQAFCPLVCITDNDTKERMALLSVWPLLIELLCNFHLRQCWTNKRKSVFRGISDIWRVVIEGRLKNLEEAYVLSNSFKFF